ncbi:class I adenylate-forming enzyme family protein [Alicycliphilus sp. T452]
MTNSTEFRTISELIREQAAKRPDHVALIDSAQTLSYGQLDQMMSRVASSLQRDGVKAGQAIAICGASCVEYAAIFLGALRAGVTVSPLAPSSKAQSLVDMLTDAGARMLFLDQAVATELEPLASAMKGIRCVRMDDASAFSSWLAPSGQAPAPVKVDADQPFNIIYSSGTTGTPKGIVQSHGMRWSHIWRGTLNGYGPDSVTLLSTPLYSNTTLASFFPSLGLGGTVILMPKFDAAEYLQRAQAYRVTHTMLVPVQYRRLLAHPEFNRYDLSSFRRKFCTSAPFSAELKREVLARWPGGLVELYGMTEGGGTCMLAAHDFPNKLHTVGRPVPGNEVLVIGEDGHELPQGETGEIVGRSGAMMIGYHNQPQKTAEAEWYDAKGRRYIRTGDVGRFDEDGFLVLLDRKKDMIISGGFNIYPSDLEMQLRQHPDVADVAVVGVPSDEWGESPAAFVVLRPSTKIQPEELRTWCNERVGKTQRLSKVVMVSELPRSPIGKVLKRSLRDHVVAMETDPDQGTHAPTSA